jgi:hypothetical protein
MTLRLLCTLTWNRKSMLMLGCRLMLRNFYDGDEHHELPRGCIVQVRACQYTLARYLEQKHITGSVGVLLTHFRN